MRPIKMTKEQIKQQVNKLIAEFPISPFFTRQSYTVNTVGNAKPTVRPTVNFSLPAIAKIREIVKLATGEVAWHGFVQYHPDRYTYLIYDIDVYPQDASAAFVTSDDAAYVAWMNKLPDAKFNDMRMQGHSHVNMGVNPSGTDLNYYTKMLSQIKDYYIFLIVNKRDDLTIFLVDAENNVVYSTDDIDTNWHAAGYQHWAKESMSVVKGNTPSIANAQRPVSDVPSFASMEEEATALADDKDLNHVLSGYDAQAHAYHAAEAMIHHDLGLEEIEDILEVMQQTDFSFVEAVDFYLGGGVIPC